MASSTTALNKDGGELLNLLLGAAQGAKLQSFSIAQDTLCRTRFLASLRARLSLLFFNNSMQRFS